MKELPPLSGLSSDEKDALIEALWKELQALRGEVEKLKRKKAKKTSRNSSLPPAKGFKSNLKADRQEPPAQRKGSLGRSGGGRELSLCPDQVIVARAKSCPHCGGAINELSQQLKGIYERIELPRVKPVVTRVERYGGHCTHCEKAYESAVPAGLEEGSPYGDSIASVVTYLRYSHALSYRRLSQAMEELYGLKISEGAIANLLQRVNQRLNDPVKAIVERLRSSRVVCSDETSARVKGKTQWEWVFQNSQVCFHLIRPSRGKVVIDEAMAGHRPQVWVSDLYSSQKAHPAQQWQVCLAHQLRDCQYAIDCGDDLFAPILKRMLLKAIGIGRRRKKLKESTLRQYVSRLKTKLWRALDLKPQNPEGQKLIRRYRRLRDNLFRFLEVEDVPPTNNSSERALRPSVIFRKVTNGFRSDWGAELFSKVRSIVGTAQRQGFSAFDAISRSLTSPQHAWLLS